jgi:hypothetical protein
LSSVFSMFSKLVRRTHLYLALFPDAMDDRVCGEHAAGEPRTGSPRPVMRPGLHTH